MLDVVRGPATRIRKTSYFTTKVNRRKQRVQAKFQISGMNNFGVIYRCHIKVETIMFVDLVRI